MAYASYDPTGPATSSAAIRENFSRILEGAAGGDGASPALSGYRAPPFAPAAPGARFGTLPPTPPRLSEGSIAAAQAASGYGYYTEDIRATASKYGAQAGLHSLNFFDLFPSLFTFSTLLVFLPPIWTTVHLGEDRSVQRWIGPWCQIALILPFIFAFAHMAHRPTGAPNKSVVMIVLLLPSITLLALNDAISTMANDKGTQLFSTDCDVVWSKRELERSWLEAYRLYQRCLADTVPLRANLTVHKAQDLFRIEDCEEYAGAHHSYAADWDYLKSLEEDHYCGGWCSLQRPLWTRKEVTDSCSIAVASVFQNKVGRFSQQVVIYMIIVLIFTSVGLVTAGPRLRKAGVDW